jgi:hypothetical protein
MRAWTFFLIGVLAASAAAAQVRQLGPHVHGLSTLDIAVDGSTVSMELESPGADIVGFETMPTTDEQRAAIARGNDALSRPLALFSFSAAGGCMVMKAQSQEVFADLTPAAPATDPPDLFDRYAQRGTHSMFEASYELRCTNPKAITGVDFPFFAVFPNAQVVHVQMVTAHGQFVFDAMRNQPRLDVAHAFQSL